MRRAKTIRFALIAVMLVAPALCAQTMVDRVAARVEGDIILESEIRELGCYQQLINGGAQSREARLGELIEQWIIKTEVAAAQFPAPSEKEVDQNVEGLKTKFGSAEAFQVRLRELGLPLAAVRRLLAQQMQASRYLEYKFRPAAQVDREQVEKYYRREFVPQMQARGQTPPLLDSVREQIHELLVQRDINQRASSWLDEARTRLKVEIISGPEPDGKKP